jgi:hypothetical protein
MIRQISKDRSDRLDEKAEFRMQRGSKERDKRRRTIRRLVETLFSLNKQQEDEDDDEDEDEQG